MQRRLLITSVIILLTIILLSVNVKPAAASFLPKKTSSTGLNFMIRIDGEDFRKVKTSSFWRLEYAYRAARWIVNTYFSYVRMAKEIEDIAIRKLGIPLPPAARLTISLLETGLALHIFSILNTWAPKCNAYIEIHVRGPPFPATWYVVGY